MSFALLVLTSVVAVDFPRPFTTADSPPEYGFGLTPQEAHDGWLSLYDGKTDFGWKEAKVEYGLLANGETTSRFGSVELIGEAVAAGELVVGNKSFPVPEGKFKFEVRNAGSDSIRVGSGLKVKSLVVRPLNLRTMLNGKNVDGWNVLKHSRLPANRQAKWRVEDGVVIAIGGPGALELDGRYGNLVLQVEVRTRAKLVNGGVFFRSIPGDFLNGYEVQVFNACYEGDPGQPARYSTGAIDDRQLARRLVSRDQDVFKMSIIATGPRIATWVNGYQVIDWIDTREQDENPRKGLRLKPGTIQLQAHDQETNLEFHSVLLAELP